MEINGKVYRNLEGQVGYLTDKYDNLQNQINDVRAHLTHYIEVDTLPTGDDIDPSAVYLLGPMGTAPDQYYEEWVYVQLADESWSWEKLGDTDSVDLSGYLQKVTTATTEKQVYTKNEDGIQTMLDVAQSVVAGAIPLRGSSGQILVPTGTPSSDSAATSKGYVVGNFVAKDTSVTTYAKAYIKKGDGSQDTLSIASTPSQGFVVQYNTGGTLRCKDPNGNGEEAVNLSYANAHYLAKNTGTTYYAQAYVKASDGTQGMLEYGTPASANMIVQRDATAQITLPNQTQYVPTDDQAVSKRYVDAVVGQLLYLHSINLVITVDASNYLLVKAYLINASSTAITSLSRDNYMRMEVEYGSFGASSNTSNTDTNAPCAVSKLPDTFRFESFNEAYPGFLYQYVSGGSLLFGVTTQSMTTTVTDTVTTW